jgi:hypothetical protein
MLQQRQGSPCQLAAAHSEVQQQRQPRLQMLLLMWLLTQLE